MPRRSFRRTGRPRPRYEWTAISNLTTAPAIIAANTLVTFTFPLPVNTAGGQTLMAIRGTLNAHSDTDSATIHVATLGFIVYNSLLAVGALNAQDLSAAWLFNDLLLTNPGQGGDTATSVKAKTHDLNVKAKRRIRSPLSRLFMFVENFDATQIALLTYTIRALWKTN